MSSNKPFVLILILLIALLAACQTPGTEPGAGEPTAPVIPETESPTETEPSTGASNPATAAAIARLASELGVGEAEIEVVSAHMTEFTDSCLGLGQLNESCLQAMTPGWLIMLSAAGQVYEVHTDQAGQQVRIATQPAG